MFHRPSLTVKVGQVDEVLEGLQPNMSGHFESLLFPFFFFFFLAKNRIYAKRLQFGFDESSFLWEVRVRYTIIQSQ